MARQRVFVGIGEALLCEYPDRVEAGGLAVRFARHAVQLGHMGVAVSRLGQDSAADELLRQLRELGIRLDALQSDPDLATGRLIVKSIAGKTSRTLTSRAAFDNLQWDFDLVDTAQQADAVLFGSLARREGQSRSIIKRFLAECLSAVRVFDMTNRAHETIDRVEARTGLEFADGLIADAHALKALAPGWNGRDVRQALLEIMRGSNLAFVVSLERGDCTETMTAHTSGQSWRAAGPYPAAQHEAAIAGLLHGVANGWDFPKSLDAAIRVADHAAKKPGEKMKLD